MDDGVVVDKFFLNDLFGRGKSPRFYFFVVGIMLVVVLLVVGFFSVPRFLDIIDYSVQKIGQEGEAINFMREQGWLCECDSGVMFLLDSEFAGTDFPIPVCDTSHGFVQSVCEEI